MQGFHKLYAIIFAVAFINFFLFIIGTVILGGDALNGKVVGDHYYLANHGQLTEVNAFVFMYSKIHAISIFITHPLAGIAGVLNWLTGDKMFKRKSWW